MKHFKLISYLVVTAALFVVSDATQAQSTDQSNPTPISSNELTIAGPKKNNQQHYYSFTAGPGEVTLTLSVKAKAYSTFVGIKVFDSELNTVAYHNMSADTGSPGMALKKFDVGEKQTLVLSFNSDPSLAECKIKFGGAVELSGTESSTSSGATNLSTAQNATVTNSMPQAQVIDQGSGTGASTSSGSNGKTKTFVFSVLDAVGQRFNIPANGRLRLEMKDGSVQEIDLINVKKILVKQ
jgi:hypothetical protein